MRESHATLIATELKTDTAAITWFYGDVAPFAELAVRQFIYDRYCSGHFNKLLYACIGSSRKLNWGLPSEWVGALSGMGWRVSPSSCALNWSRIVCVRYLHGLYTIGCILIGQLRSVLRGPLPRVPHVHFVGLTRGNLPISKLSLQGNDIFSFYCRRSDCHPRIMAIFHDIHTEDGKHDKCSTVNFRQLPYLCVKKYSDLARFLLWGVSAASIAFIAMLLGRWHFALMLSEASKARSARLLEATDFASEYLFPFSRSIFRPLWSYVAEKAGSKVSIFFYSTYAQPKLKMGFASQAYEWGPCTWNRFIVWDGIQEAMIRRSLARDIKFIHSGPINFSNTLPLAEVLPSRAIGIFDIHPQRLSCHFGISTLADCLAENPNFYIKFLSDSVEAISTVDAVAILKPKRSQASNAEKKYARVLSDMIRYKRVVVLPYDVSPLEVAKRCIATISIPFTSTAVQVHKIGMPCVFYDPSGWIQPDDPAAHGVQIISGFSNLKHWLTGVLNDR
jgi:polysaccharide biosynthesis PFTS motif protein